MDAQRTYTLPKKERLCGKTGIENLLAKGHHGSVSGLKYIWRADNGLGFHRIMVSVPKKMFKRAVKRNLLKRRIRECWRRQKHDLAIPAGADILFIYTTKEILTYDRIYVAVGQVIERLNSATAKTEAPATDHA